MRNRAAIFLLWENMQQKPVVCRKVLGAFLCLHCSHWGGCSLRYLQSKCTACCANVSEVTSKLSSHMHTSLTGSFYHSTIGGKQWNNPCKRLWNYFPSFGSSVPGRLLSFYALFNQKLAYSIGGHTSLNKWECCWGGGKEKPTMAIEHPPQGSSTVCRQITKRVNPWPHDTEMPLYLPWQGLRASFPSIDKTLLKSTSLE